LRGLKIYKVIYTISNQDRGGRKKLTAMAVQLPWLTPTVKRRRSCKESRQL
jgi:hypothetical protein